MNNECKLQTFYEEYTATEVTANASSTEWKGNMVWIRGGNDRWDLFMRQVVLTYSSVYLLLSKEHSYYRPKRTGPKKYKSTWEAFWIPIWVFSTWLLKRGGGIYSWTARQFCASAVGTQKSKQNPPTLQSPKEDNVHQYVVINTEGEKHPKFSILLLHLSCNSITNCSKENNTLRKMRLQNTLSFRTRKWRKPRNNVRNRLPRHMPWAGLTESFYFWVPTK